MQGAVIVNSNRPLQSTSNVPQLPASAPSVHQRSPVQALKRFLKVVSHFKEFRDDQFDFHNYCLRKHVRVGLGNGGAGMLWERACVPSGSMPGV